MGADSGIDSDARTFEEPFPRDVRRDVLSSMFATRGADIVPLDARLR